MDVTFHDKDTGEIMTFPCLNLGSMMKTKFRACVDRGVDRDYTDIRYLVDTYPGEVREMANELDVDDVSLVVKWFGDEDRKRMEEILR